MHNSFTLSFNKIFKYSFILIIPILFFLPSDVLAAEPITNITNYEFYWKATNLYNGQVEDARTSLRPLQQMQMGISGQDYSLIRIGPLINYQGLGYNATYSADVLFYIETHEPFSFVNPSCALWSANGEKSSCSAHKVSEVQIDSNKVLVTYKASYNWTSSSNYVEFTMNFESTNVRPNETVFFYQINDFYGNVSDGQIIVDGLEGTNQKLDDINDNILDDDTSHSMSQFDSFISNFEFKDNGGLSSIVTMPLNLLRNILVNDSCVDISLPMFGEDIHLPSGCSFWSHFPESAIVLWNTLFGGLFSYVLLTNLFHDIHRLKDPHDLGVDTLDL